MERINPQSGIVRSIILVLIAIIVLSFLGFDLKAIVDDPLTQKNLNYVFSGVSHVWNGYLEGPILYFWHNIFIALLWDTFVANFEKIKTGEPHFFEENASGVDLETAN